MVHRFFIFILIFLSISGVNVSFSQENDAHSDKSDRELKRKEKKEKHERRMNSGKPMLIPVLAPGYTPELGFLGVAGVLLSFKTNLSDSLIQRSSFPMAVSYSTNGSVVFNSFLKSFWLKDKLRINGEFWFKNMPDNYWGIGYQNAIDPPVSDKTTTYKRKWWWINPSFFWQFRKNFFLGMNIDLNYTEGYNESEGVAGDPVYQKYNKRPFNSGIGAIFRYDTRDIPVDTHVGLLLDMRATFYSSYLGSMNDYRVYQIEYKQFTDFGKRHVLGWYLKGRFTSGEVPYGEMSQLGSPFDFRGYIWGRFRDNNMMFFLSEYRYRFMNKKGDPGRHGPVAWVGTGTVFNNAADPENNFHFLPNYGLGYRFEIASGLNVRLDYGFGKDTSAFYFNFNQAF
jgi:hypothetical protein